MAHLVPSSGPSGSVMEDDDRRRFLSMLPLQDLVSLAAVAADEVARSLTTVQTSIAGHVDCLWSRPDDRQRALGVPCEGTPAFRDAADYLRRSTHIPLSEAKRRMTVSAAARRTITPSGTRVDAPRPELSATLAQGGMNLQAAHLVAETLATAEQQGTWSGLPVEDLQEVLEAGERALVHQAAEGDVDTLRRVCERWRRHFAAVVSSRRDRTE